MDRTFGVVSREVLVAGDGLSFLRGIIAGSHPAPPFAGAMDFDLVEADEGGARRERRDRDGAEVAPRDRFTCARSATKVRLT